MSAPYVWALADLDPVAAVLTWIKGHEPLMQRMEAMATGSGALVSASNEPPYPHIRVDDSSPGDLRQVRHLITCSINFEILADLDGTPGKGQLSRLAVALAEVLAEMTAQPQVRGVVFTSVEGVTVLHSPLPTGQDRYLLGATLYCHAA